MVIRYEAWTSSWQPRFRSNEPCGIINFVLWLLRLSFLCLAFLKISVCSNSGEFSLSVSIFVNFLFKFSILSSFAVQFFQVYFLNHSVFFDFFFKEKHVSCDLLHNCLNFWILLEHDRGILGIDFVRRDLYRLSKRWRRLKCWFGLICCLFWLKW